MHNNAQRAEARNLSEIVPLLHRSLDRNERKELFLNKAHFTLLPGKWRRFPLVWCLALSIMLLSLTSMSAPRAFAASSTSDPLVTIAVDLTPASCTITQTATPPPTVHQAVWREQSHCPAGSVTGMKNIPLSQAKAQREAYVMYPPANAPASAWATWKQKFAKLREAKSQTVQKVASASVRPQYTCGWNTESTMRSSYSGTGLDFTVYYYLSYDCSTIVLNREEVTGLLPVVAPAYWTALYYSGYRNNCPLHYEYIGSQDLNIYPGVSEPDGLYNIWMIGAGNPCFGQNSSPDIAYQFII